jgi:hypothetical protein
LKRLWNVIVTGQTKDDDFWFVRNLLERIRQPFGLRARIEPQWKSTIPSNSVDSSDSSTAMETGCCLRFEGVCLSDGENDREFFQLAHTPDTRQLPFIGRNRTAKGVG